MLADVQTLGAIIRGRSLDALGHLGECVPWLCSMLADVQTLAQPFGAVALKSISQPKKGENVPIFALLSSFCPHFFINV